MTAVWGPQVAALPDWERPYCSSSGRYLNRKTAWHTLGPCHCSYDYGGFNSRSRPPPPIIDDISENVAETSGHGWVSQGPTGIVRNAYIEQEDACGWHSDDEPRVRAQESVVLSLSLGAARIFEVRNNATRVITSVKLQDGDLCVMAGKFQTYYQHRVRRRTQDPLQRGPRYSLSWRAITTHSQECASKCRSL